jgi:hypothetical protein
MIHMGCSQTLYATIKLSKRDGGISRNGMLRLEKLVHDIKEKVEQAIKIDEGMILFIDLSYFSILSYICR